MGNLYSNKSDGIIEISFNDLKAVALLYNFLANGKMLLSKLKIYDFYNYLSQCNYPNDNENISYKFVLHSESDGLLENSIGDSIFNIDVKALNLENLMEHYKRLPEDIVSKTLTEDALDMIEIDKKKLDIINDSREYYGNIVIYTMGEKSATESARRCLASYGFENIKITRVFYLGSKGDHSYHISYNANNFFEHLDTEKAKTKIKERQN